MQPCYIRWLCHITAVLTNKTPHKISTPIEEHVHWTKCYTDFNRITIVTVNCNRRNATCAMPHWMVAYLGYTQRMKTLFRGWPVMVHDTNTRRRRSTKCLVFTSYSGRFLKQIITPWQQTVCLITVLGNVGHNASNCSRSWLALGPSTCAAVWCHMSNLIQCGNWTDPTSKMPLD